MLQRKFWMQCGREALACICSRDMLFRHASPPSLRTMSTFSVRMLRAIPTSWVLMSSQTCPWMSSRWASLAWCPSPCGATSQVVAFTRWATLPCQSLWTGGKRQWHQWRTNSNADLVSCLVKRKICENVRIQQWFRHIQEYLYGLYSTHTHTHTSRHTSLS